MSKFKIPMHGIIADNQELKLGDAVKKLTDALGIKMESCNCSVRQRKLNQLVSFTGKQSYLRRDGK